MAIVQHLVRHDPEGCWLAERSETPIGFAIASIREDLWWGIATYVDPSSQSRGVGQGLIDRIYAYSNTVGRGMLTTSGDPGSRDFTSDTSSRSIQPCSRPAPRHANSPPAQA